MSPHSGRQNTPSARALIAFVVGYAIAVKLGEHVYGSLAVPSPFWLPDSVLLCALLMAPPEHGWIYVAAIWPIRIVVGSVAGTPLWFELTTIAIDSLKGVVAARLLYRYVRRPILLHTLGGFLIYLSVAAAAVPAAAALLAAAARYALGDSFWRAAYQWFLGNALAQVIVTPTLVYWFTHAYRHAGARIGELLILLAGLTAAVFYAFVVNHASYSLNFVYVPVPFLLWAAVRLRPFGTANAIALVALVSMVGAVGGTGVFAGYTPGNAVLSIQLFLLVIAISLLSLAILIAEREALRAREVELNGRLLEAQERERARIARELHDDLGQRMALLQVGIEQFGKSAELPATVRQQLDSFAQIAGQMSSDIHVISHKLHPSTLDVVGLEIALRGLCREFSVQHRLQAQFSCRDVPPHIDGDVSLCVFRIVQEALHNVVKHSGVSAASVELSCRDNRLALSVSDAGKGFDLRGMNHQDGLGLVSMRERLRSIGGQLSIQSTPHFGTRVTVDVPLRAVDDAGPAWAIGPMAS